MAMTTTARTAKVMTDATERLQDSGFDGAQTRAVIMSAAEIVDDAIRPLATKEDLAEVDRRLTRVEEELSLVREEVSTARKEAAAAHAEARSAKEEAVAAKKEAVAAREEAAAAREEAVAAREEAAAAREEAAAAREEAAAAKEEAVAARKAAAAVHEAVKALGGELETFQTRFSADMAAEMAKGFARAYRHLWIMVLGAVGTTAAITLGIVRLLM